MYHRRSLSRKSRESESSDVLVMTAPDASHHRIILIPPNPDMIHQISNRLTRLLLPLPKIPQQLL